MLQLQCLYLFRLPHNAWNLKHCCRLWISKKRLAFPNFQNRVLRALNLNLNAKYPGPLYSAPISTSYTVFTRNSPFLSLSLFLKVFPISLRPLSYICHLKRIESSHTHSNQVAFTVPCDQPSGACIEYSRHACTAIEHRLADAYGA